MFTLIDADREHSISWKKNSRELLMGATDLPSFKRAVKWCGAVGNVTRTVSKEYFNAFAEYLYSNVGRILAGQFDLREVPEFGGKVPTSWVSKVCHIMNPYDYPIIYDEFLRRQFDVSNVDEFWDVILHERPISKHTRYDKIWYKDSDIWAKQKLLGGSTL